MLRYVHRAGVAVFTWRQAGTPLEPLTLAPRDNHRRYVSRGRVVRGVGAYGVSTGAVDALPVSSTQPNIASPGSIAQTHLVTSANSTQPNVAAAGAITLGGMVTAANSAQINIASASAIWQMHLVGVASASQGNVASAGAVSTGGATVVSVQGARAGGPGSRNTTRPRRVASTTR